MSIPHINAVKRLPRGATANTTQRLVLMVLADRADSTGHCWPHQSTLADECGIAETTARHALTALADAGLIVVERSHRADGKYGGNHYRLTLSTTVLSETVDHRPERDGQEPPLLEPPVTTNPQTDGQPRPSWRGALDEAIATFMSNAEQAPWRPTALEALRETYTASTGGGATEAGFDAWHRHLVRPLCALLRNGTADAATAHWWVAALDAHPLITAHRQRAHPTPVGDLRP